MIRPQPHARGFTLIELMIAVAIVAIIAAVALPSFQQSMRKSRRADAFAVLAQIQQAQERWRANNTAYSTSTASTALNINTDLATYDITLSAPDPEHASSLATGYVFTAVGKGAQAGEAECKKLSARVVDGNILYAACHDCAEFSYQRTNSCWSR